MLAFAILNCSQIIIAVEALSLLESISLSGLLLFHGIIFGILLALRLKPPVLSLSHAYESFGRIWRLSDIPLKALLAVTLLAALSIFMLVVYLPPNNHDSMTYHMARVGYYLQHASLKSYPTANLRQTVSPANAEILILWQATLLRSDRTAGLVQWFSWIGCILAIYGIGRQLRAPPKGALFAALAFASFPAVALESSTTQNDLTAAFFLLCAFLFVGEARKAPAAYSLLCGASLGLAVGTKILSLLMLPGFGMYAVVWYFHTRSLTHRDALRFLALCLICCLALGSFIYFQNLSIHGHLSGPAPFRSLHSLDRFEWHTAWSNTGRFVMQLMDPNGIVPPWPPIRKTVSRFYCAAADTLFQKLRISPHLPGKDFMDQSWSQYHVLWMHEDFAAFGPVFGYLGLAAILFQLLRPGIRGIALRQRSLALASILYLILMAATLRYQPTSNRLLIPMAAVGAPLLACLYSRGERWVPLIWNLVLSTICAASLLGSLLLNQMKPLIGNSTIWTKDRIQVMTRSKPGSESMFRFADRVIPGGATLGFVPSTGDSYEYPLFGRNFERRVIPVRIDRKELLSPGKLPSVDYLIVEGERQEPFLVGETDIPKTQFGFGNVDLRPLLAALREAKSGWHPVFDLEGSFHFFTKGGKGVDPSLLPDSIRGNWNIWADHWVDDDFIGNVSIDPARPWLKIRGDVPDLGVQPIIRIEGRDGELLDRIEPAAGKSFESTIPLSSFIPEFSGRYVALRFRSNLLFNPRKLGQSDDDRNLSWRLYEFKLSAQALPEIPPGDWNKWADHWVKQDFDVQVLIDPAKPYLWIRGDAPNLGLRPIITVEGPDQRPLDTIQPAAGSLFEHAISLSPLIRDFAGKYAVLKFRSNLQFNPRKLGQSEDDRDLSWRIYEFHLISSSSAP